MSFFSFVAFSKGSFSKIVFSFFIKLRNFLFDIKNPPLIQLLLVWGFSLKEVTLFLVICISPNLACGLTAVTVMSFFFYYEILIIVLYLNLKFHLHM